MKLPQFRAAALSGSAMAAGLCVSAMVSPAAAQAVPAADPPAALPSTAASADATSEADNTQVREIVVTGTLIRGVAPVGTNVIGVSTADIRATGASSTNNLLATIPQVSNFNSFPSGSASFGQPIAQTNLRNLGASGGTTTLLLLNGHRLVGSGILQTYADPTIIPPGIIERVEVVPDGGSSIYGSDAIGGVINIITRKRSSGVDIAANYGFADGYATLDGNVTAGKDWGSGSFTLSYAYAWHNNIQGIERDYVTQNNTANGGSDRRVTTCAQPNLIVGGVTYAMPGLVAGTRNLCSNTDYADIYPRERRHTVFGTLDQDLSDKLSFNLTGYFSERVTHTLTAPLSTNSTITSANPYFRPIGTETSQQVLFDYSPVFGKGTDNPARFNSWGFTPTFTYSLPHDWKLRGMLNYGQSYNSTTERSINTDAVNAALAATTTSAALDPYDLSQTNPAVLTGIRGYTNFSEATQKLAEARIVADGAVLSLPGGDLRLAVGSEYHWEKIDAHIAFGADASPKQNRAIASRNVASIYGEVLVPLVGPGNAMTLVQALDLTGSVRYDHYDDVGGTTNPKIGFTYRPVHGISFRGNWGTSFHAPSLADTTGAVDARVSSIPIVLNLAPGSSPADMFRPILYISGGNPNLRPERATTWSLGTDIQPDFFKGLTISATYYNVDFKDQISVNIGGLLGGASFYADPTNAPFYILNPTLAQATAFSGGVRADNFTSLASFFAANNPYAIYDLRRYNRGRLKQDGIDFNVTLRRPVGFGTINAGFAGTYTLHRKTKDSPTSAFVERLDNGVSRFNFVASLGLDSGALSSRVSLNHSGGYPIIGEPLQPRVGAFNTVNLFAALDLEKLGLKRPVSLSLTVNNLLDQDPPWRNAGSGYANGSTLGRLVQFGLRTKF
ncbi:MULTISPECIES: TonB-dependent receptor domain-containing protein [unclassified Novosphingobium]|uniref:TonB-dependent receptor domain-containing protein n=1 Tax=unclassified Novosphingobium TaxID=2644732 RepID=UPI0014947606|nr:MULTISPECIES: TonB-dependent receptor [unclassified Novosphingobium]MBB3360002.1 iron complex outermembrane receptor protein [Novosphingobium sp. BK256]MBB3376361.1 iron complex outermembrane receptor protein [Novosphingobium sp. BK280]MBB3380758.1 iron complex outermembrane receptor protein [Novosphingobium sp. BK258]MBB3422426.1 iron complex outermembrane receptor protein [Novosphingobium sp. BK267]MBB3451109.1 iron complex outermembrane receptor protein [Novosphingobium sp. BK352]